MRTTVTFAPDVAAAVEQLRKEKGIGMSEAVNHLLRLGLMAPKERKRYKVRSTNLGLRIDVSNIQEALDIAEGIDRKW